MINRNINFIFLCVLQLVFCSIRGQGQVVVARIAVSASSARVTIQFSFLVCKLHFSPFSNKEVSLSGKVTIY